MAKSTDLIANKLKGPIEQAGYELWDVEYKKEGKKWFLRLFIEHQENITLDDCIKVNEIVEPILEESDIIPQEYFLEVSSPGIYRPLKKPEHFTRFIGYQIHTQLFEAVSGNKKFEGQLESASSEGITILLNNQERIRLSYQQIAKARLDS